MLCPSCHRQTPDAGAFCLNCGARLSSSSPPAKADWEYKDFVYRFPAQAMWARIGSGAYSEAGAKLEFWQNYQREIHKQLQTWLDDGWKPIGTIDAGCIEIRTSQSHRDKSCGYWFWVLILSIPTYGLALLFALIFGRSTLAEPVKFVAPMRRLKPNVLVQPPSVQPPAVPRLPTINPMPAFPHQQPSPSAAQAFAFCSRCAHANRSGAKFCQRCGQKL